MLGLNVSELGLECSLGWLSASLMSLEQQKTYLCIVGANGLKSSTRSMLLRLTHRDSSGMLKRYRGLKAAGPCCKVASNTDVEHGTTSLSSPVAFTSAMVKQDKRICRLGDKHEKPKQLLASPSTWRARVGEGTGPEYLGEKVRGGEEQGS